MMTKSSSLYVSLWMLLICSGPSAVFLQAAYVPPPSCATVNVVNQLDCLPSAVFLQDAYVPLPSCASVNVVNQRNCTNGCADLTESRKEFQDVNGDVRCDCNPTKLCSDSPTCEELLIYPGSVLAGCENVCDDVVSVDDYVRFAGTITNFNLDKTHLVVSCSCNGQELCNDEIEFSDRVELDQCTPILRRRVRCMNFCSSFEPLFTGVNYTSTDGYATCSCNSEEGEAIKCADQVPTSSGPYHRSATLTFGTLFAALFLASVV